MTALATSRRSALLGLVAALAGAPAWAASQARTIIGLPGFKAWKKVSGRRGNLPLTHAVKGPKGEVSLKDWIGEDPAVLILWASWCGPCWADKPLQAQMQRKLAAAGSKTRIVLVQCFDDDADPAAVERMMRKVGATDLRSAVATPSLEADFRKWFGASPVDPGRTSLPCMALISSGGETLGWLMGRPFTRKDQEWWPQPEAFELLTQLP